MQRLYSHRVINQSLFCFPVGPSLVSHHPSMWALLSCSLSPPSFRVTVCFSANCVITWVTAILGLYPEEGSDWAVNAPGGKITVLLLRIMGKDQEATEAGLSSACLHRIQTKLLSSINYGLESDGSLCDATRRLGEKLSYL